MNLASWRVRYPEFMSVGDTLAQAALDAALAQLDPTVMSSYLDEAQGLLAADILALSPNGLNSRLQSDKGVTTYGTKLRALRVEAAFALRVF